MGRPEVLFLPRSGRFIIFYLELGAPFATRLIKKIRTFSNNQNALALAVSLAEVIWPFRVIYYLHLDLPWVLPNLGIKKIYCLGGSDIITYHTANTGVKAFFRTY
jgi:hypothetical protein